MSHAIEGLPSEELTQWAIWRGMQIQALRQVDDEIKSLKEGKVSKEIFDRSEDVIKEFMARVDEGIKACLTRCSHIEACMLESDDLVTTGEKIKSLCSRVTTIETAVKETEISNGKLFGYIALFSCIGGSIIFALSHALWDLAAKYLFK